MDKETKRQLVSVGATIALNYGVQLIELLVKALRQALEKSVEMNKEDLENKEK